MGIDVDTTVLVTTGNGMFGGALIRELAGTPDINVRALVRDASRFTVSAPNVTVVVGDMDKPETLTAAVEGATHIFLVTPMDDHIVTRERAVTDAAVASASNPHILKIHGAVEHRGDHLSSMHLASIDYIKASGLNWSLISPNSVMETSLLGFAGTVKMDAIFGMSGHGKVGFVALEDIARATATVIKQGLGGNGDNFLLTGPRAIDLYEVAEAMSTAVGRDVTYYDMPEEAFANVLLQEKIYPDRDSLETNVLCHLRAWGRGDASLVT
ncbi:MAG: NAD(P)H-binding protein, partial [Actinobacteria bacterium]|nr:NAD(P)H-binding protein [Actinomycetota bacterium]